MSLPLLLILLALSYALSAAALPAPDDLTLHPRQTVPYAVGTCTVADSQCIITLPGTGGLYNFTCGFQCIFEGPSYVYQSGAEVSC